MDKLDYEKRSINVFAVLTACALAWCVLALALVGCIHPREVDIERLDALYEAWWESYTNELAQASGGTVETPPQDADADGGTVETPPQDPGDAVPYGALQWRYGGFNGAKAAHDPGADPLLSDMRSSARALSFRYRRDLRAWGLPHDDAGAIAAIFIQDSAGRWIGGKFDWISSSRTSREYKHIIVEPQYSNWASLDWSAVPYPAKVAFVIISKDGRRRSNVIATDWRR